jgi:malonate-semialdehyde dehydrogenase (acetylating)/methylmalonate-semialdehyde dehydrogenase
MLSRSLRTSSRSPAFSRALSTSSPRLALADIEALASTKQWKGTHTDGKPTTFLSGGEYTTGSTQQWIDVHDPSTQRVLTRVPETTQEDMTRIVDRAEQAFLEWKDSSILKRQAVMLK